MTEKSDWTVESIKEHFEDLLIERDKAVQTSFDLILTAINKLEDNLHDTLTGFPQEYARKTDFETLDTSINKIKEDHVQRAEFSQLKDEQSSGRGARTAFSAGLGIVVSLIAVALGAMYSGQLTNHDVSTQIERESPWAKDRPEIENELKLLEKQILILQTRQTQHEATDKLRAALAKNK